LLLATHGGTGISNPSPSSGESGANLNFGVHPFDEGGFQPSQSALPLGDRRWRRLLGFGSLYGFKSGYWLVVIGRTGSGLPGVAKESPCFEHLERPCTRASRPRKKSRGCRPRCAVRDDHGTRDAAGFRWRDSLPGGARAAVGTVDEATRESHGRSRQWDILFRYLR